VAAEVQTDETVDEALLTRLTELELRLREAEASSADRIAAAEAEKLELVVKMEATQLEVTSLTTQLDLARQELEEKLKLGIKIHVSVIHFF
jgi:hypothetical protein